MRRFSVSSSPAKCPHESSSLPVHNEGFQASAYSATAHQSSPTHDHSPYHDSDTASDDDNDDDDGDDDIDSALFQQPAAAALVTPARPWAMTSCADPPQGLGPPVQYSSQLHHGPADYNVNMSDSEAEGGVPLGYVVTATGAPLTSLSAPADALEYDLDMVDSASFGEYHDDEDSDYEGDDDDEDGHVEDEDQLSNHFEIENPQQNFGFYPSSVSEPDIADYAELPPLGWADIPDSIMSDGMAGDLLPINPSNPNPNSTGPTYNDNSSLFHFLQVWDGRYRLYPRRTEIVKQSEKYVGEVRYDDLDGDRCDFQGMNWEAMGIARMDARVRRHFTYRNYVNRFGSDRWHTDDAMRLPRQEDFFRFKSMTIDRQVNQVHFQLRNMLACPSRSRAFYSSSDGIRCFNPISRITDLVVNVNDFSDPSARISTLDANFGVLMGGTSHGDYCLRPINSSARGFTEGRITNHESSYTNDLKMHTPRRSSNPIAAIASNDCVFRLMDVETQHFISKARYDYPLNCSAVSPDRQLRVAVGDNVKALILHSETGEILQQLAGHRDYGFACDWSDDGWTVATSSQDKTVHIWDARRWCDSKGTSTPLATIMCELAGARNLRFSPSGSGKRILVAAEAADYVNLIDAHDFSSKQTIDIFGNIGGVDFTNEGQDLTVLCTDQHRGGLMQLERCGRGPEYLWEDSVVLRAGQDGWRPDREKSQPGRGSLAGLRTIQRRTVTHEAMEPF